MISIENIIERVSSSKKPSREDIVSLLSLEGDDATKLFEAADSITKQNFNNEIYIRGIIEFSNYCRCNCSYCGLAAFNRKIPRYRMSVEEIVETAHKAFEASYKTIVLQSGEDMFYTSDMICEIVKQIKSIGDIAITLSVGERPFEEYQKFIEAGADRFLIKHETADETLYNSLHPHSNFENRITCLKNLKKLGFQTGSGFMIGLPGQTLDTIASDILLLHDLGIHMAGIGPFLPHPETPLKDTPSGSTFLTLKAVALTRLIIKNAMLPATTSLGVANVADKNHSFKSGANVIMQKLQPYKYRRLYEIYPKATGHEKSIIQERQELENLIKSFGRSVSASRGDHKNFF